MVIMLIAVHVEHLCKDEYSSLFSNRHKINKRAEITVRVYLTVSLWKVQNFFDSKPGF